MRDTIVMLNNMVYTNRLIRVMFIDIHICARQFIHISRMKALIPLSREFLSHLSLVMTRTINNIATLCFPIITECEQRLLFMVIGLIMRVLLYCLPLEP